MNEQDLLEKLRKGEYGLGCPNLQKDLEEVFDMKQFIEKDHLFNLAWEAGHFFGAARVYEEYLKILSILALKT